MKFIKVVLGSCLGALLALGALMLIGFIIVSAMASSVGSSTVDVKSGSVLKLSLSAMMPEQTNNVASSFNEFNTADIIGLHDAIAGLDRAATDNRIKAVLLDLTSVPLGMASTSELRNAILEFKKSEKPIYAYADYYSHKTYGLATAADSILMNPNGMIEFKGFGSMMPFMKEFLDKIGVNAQVFYAGDFKSATEPLRYNKMSDFNREQIRDYLGDLYNTHLTEVTSSREVTRGTLNMLAKDEVFVRPNDALQHKLIDAVAYRDQLESRLKSAIGKDEINYIDLTKYASEKAEVDYSIKNKIAVVYAEGSIENASDAPAKITYEGLGKTLSELVDEDKVKAVVLRINSGGGDALVSDNIWREVERIKATGKPVVASFGDVAASGGYYIAAGADQIFAQANTVTGSIGAFGMIPDASELMEEKLGVHFDTVQMAPHATSFTPFRSLSEKEYGLLQEYIYDIYDLFTSRVAEGRGMEMPKVKEIARGRVYSGERALELGLVDKIGGLQDAVATAAELAEVDSYRTSEYPKRKDPVQQLIEDFMGGNAQMNSVFFNKIAGPLSPYLQELIRSNEARNETLRPQTRMSPFIIKE